MGVFSKFLSHLKSRVSRWPQTRQPLRRTSIRPLLELLEGRVLMHASPVMDAEHLAVFGSVDATTGQLVGGLAPDSSIEVRSITSGKWSEGTTWSTGNVPQFGDDVV